MQTFCISFRPYVDFGALGNIKFARHEYSYMYTGVSLGYLSAQNDISPATGLIYGAQLGWAVGGGDMLFNIEFAPRFSEIDIESKPYYGGLYKYRRSFFFLPITFGVRIRM